MNKKLFLAALLIVGSMAYANNFEVKLGADMFRDLTKDQYDSEVVNLDPGYSVGAEYVIDTDSNFDFGIGVEYKSQIEGNGSYSAHSAVPIYLLGRYGLEDGFYLVGRAGYALNTDEGQDIEDTDDGLYVGVGLGKELTERINLELMYEGLDYEYETAVDDVDGWYSVVSLKFGVELGAFGKEEEEPEIVEEMALVEEPMVEPEPVVEEVVVPEETLVEEVVAAEIPELYLLGFALSPRFDFDKYDLKPEVQTEIQETAEAIKGRKGRLILVGHADSMGSEDYNMKLSQKRADEVKAEFEMYLMDEEIEIVTEAMGETMPVADNATEDGRMENRRVEVKFELTEEMAEEM